MTAGEYCNRNVVITTKDESVQEAINLMRSHHVGDVVVVEKQDGSPLPVGILTDRDIVLEILAEDVELDSVNIGDVMSYELHTVKEETKLLDCIKLMRDKGIRRLPVVDSEGGLAGMLTVDDVLELIAEQLTDIVSLFPKQQTQERKRNK